MRILETFEEVEDLGKLLLTESAIEVDSETTGLHFKKDRMLMLQIGTREEQYIIDLRKLNIEPLREAFESRKIFKLFHNALFDLCFIMEHTGIRVKRVWDTMLVEKVILGNTIDKANLLDTVKRRLDVDLDKEVVTTFINMPLDAVFTKEQYEYAAADVTYLHDVALKQMARLRELNLRHIADLENRLVEVTAEMRFNGIGFDEKAWRKLAVAHQKEYDEQHAKMPEGILWTSEKQVKAYFLKEHRIKITSYKELPKLVGMDDMLDQFIKLRKLYQNVKLYGEKWFEISMGNKAPIKKYPTVIDGSVHANFNQILETGRYSCSQPNLQQIPHEGVFRKCFVARPGKMLVIADYSGQELAIAAKASGEEEWLKIIRTGGDIHQMTADMAGVDRRIAKRVSFAILFGSGAQTAAQAADIQVALARSIIKTFKSRYPVLHSWMQGQAQKGEESGESFSLYGRRRNMIHDEYRYTKSINNPIQATGADILKLAMVFIHEYLEERNILDIRIVLAVHDEIILEASVNHTELAAAILRLGMEKASCMVLGEDLIKAETVIAPVWDKG